MRRARHQAESMVRRRAERGEDLMEKPRERKLMRMVSATP